jgi:hypothetical protein
MFRPVPVKFQAQITFPRPFPPPPALSAASDCVLAGDICTAMEPLPRPPSQWTPWQPWHSFRFSTDGTAPAIATGRTDRAAAAIRTPVPTRFWTQADSAAAATGYSSIQVWTAAMKEWRDKDMYASSDVWQAAEELALIESRKTLADLVKAFARHTAAREFVEQLRRIRLEHDPQLPRPQRPAGSASSTGLSAASAAAAPPGKAAKKRPASSLGLPAASSEPCQQPAASFEFPTLEPRAKKR